MILQHVFLSLLIWNLLSIYPMMNDRRLHLNDDHYSDPLWRLLKVQQSSSKLLNWLMPWKVLDCRWLYFFEDRIFLLPKAWELVRTNRLSLPSVDNHQYLHNCRYHSCAVTTLLLTHILIFYCELLSIICHFPDVTTYIKAPLMWLMQLWNG